MTPRTSTRRTRARALAVVGALVSTVGLGACSALGDPSAAALVDGEVVVTQDEVVTVVRELPLEVTDGQPIDPAQIVTILAFSDIMTETAREIGAAQGAVEAQRFLDEATGAVPPAEPTEEAGEDPGDEAAEGTPGDYSDATLEVMAVVLMGAEVQQDPEAAATLGERLEDLRGRLELNPRFGEVLPAESGGFVGPVQHPWLVGRDA